MSTEPKIHPTAIVDDNVTIGEESRIWHFVHVTSGASIGKKCSLGQNVFIGKDVKLGDGVKVQNNVSVYEGVHVEDDVFLGPSCVFTNVNNPRAFIERKSEYRPTHVKRGVTVGANAVIVCGHTLGEYSFVGAGSVVTKDVAPYALMVGNPARRIGWVSKGGRRLNETQENGAKVGTCPETGERYSISEEGCKPL